MSTVTRNPSMVTGMRDSLIARAIHKAVNEPCCLTIDQRRELTARYRALAEDIAEALAVGNEDFDRIGFLRMSLGSVMEDSNQ